MLKNLFLCRAQQKISHFENQNAEIAQLVEHNLAAKYNKVFNLGKGGFIEWVLRKVKCGIFVASESRRI